MRILVFSDIHANLAALEAVLDAAGDADAAWFLGDLVGYGPNPNECIQRVRELPALICLQGNHDAAAVGELPLDSFNPDARTSIEWLRDNLAEDGRAFLSELSPRAKIDDVTLVHASPRQPVLEYLLDTQSANQNFNFFDGPFCFVGHTHIPVHFTLNANGASTRMRIPRPNSQTNLEGRCIINPGSVGQPRDRDPRAAFAIFDTELKTWDYRRVDYDVGRVQAQMREAHLPERHVVRLAVGW